jgi:hypothetical protein
MKSLRRYWFKFGPLKTPSALNIGCGITAYDYDDAINVLREQVFASQPLPSIASFVEDVDVSTLDQKHVLPNLGQVVKRGVWFPLGFESVDR